MSQWLGAIALVLSFVILFQLLGLGKNSGDVIRISRYSMKIISSSKLSDEQKESRLQKNSQNLFGLFFILALKLAIAILIPLAILWLGDRWGWLSLSAVLDATVSPVFLIVSSILAIAVLCLKPNKKSKGNIPQTSSYSQLDRTLHQVAFNTYTAQIALADVEDSIFSQQLAACKSDRPVFITALPRAGTTLLLECCANSPEFAAHRYRDMPFVLIPCLWNRFSQTFQQQVRSTERAHGDGMQISPDSHEALEEVVWKTFWKRHYQKDRIVPWDYEQNGEFNEFLDSHLRKIILLRRQNLVSSVRYVSKNNANIARTKIIRQLYPNSTIVVPFRHPLNHASSLLQQHLNFLQIHQGDPFASEYMKAIGHYDFGQNLRPIDFDGWFDRRQSKDAKTLSFWIEYWIASYKHLLADNSSLHFLDYDRLCANPVRELTTLAEIVDSCDRQALVSSASRIRQPKQRRIETNNLPISLEKEAESVYARLKDTLSN